MHGTHPMALQQWIDAQIHLSEAIQAFVSATIHLESTCTPFAIESHPALMATIENNLETLVHDELASHRTQAALKKKRNSYISFINLLPSELLAYIFKIAVVPTPPRRLSDGYDERKLSQVCSRWRQIALEVCPAWPQVALATESYGISEGDLRRVAAVFYDAAGNEKEVLIDRPPNMEYALYIQTALDTISPYIKQLNAIVMSTDDADRLQPFLDFWLEKGAPGSVTELDLSIARASVVFSEANSLASNRLCQFLGYIEQLSLRSVGLDWSCVSFERLTFMSLQDLPPICCPTLAQLARILSTCSRLRSLWFKRITIPASLDTLGIEPVALEYLETLTLEAVNFAGVLSIISPRRREINIRLRDVTCDADTVASLYSFAGRSNIAKLTMTLPKTRSDEALTRLLHSPISQLPDLECLSIEDAMLRDSELAALAQNGDPPPSASIATTGETSKTNRLELRDCTIYTTPAMFRTAMAPLLWRKLALAGCDHFITTHGEVHYTARRLERITAKSEFGARLNELMPGRLEF